MLVTKKGQVTIPKLIRTAAGVAPGSEAFALDAGRIVITKMSTGTMGDRRGRLRAAAARARASMSAEFSAMRVDEILEFLRPTDPANVLPL